MGRAKRTFDEKKLSNWKLLEQLRLRLAKMCAQRPNAGANRRGTPERLLLAEHYFSLMLFGLFNPVVDRMRGLCAASRLRRVQDEVCVRSVRSGQLFGGAECV